MAGEGEDAGTAGGDLEGGVPLTAACLYICPAGEAGARQGE